MRMAENEEKTAIQPTDSLTSGAGPIDNTQDFLPLIRYKERYIIQSDTELTDELIKEWIDDPENDRKAFIVLDRNEQDLTMCPDTDHSYADKSQFVVTNRKLGKGAYGTTQELLDLTSHKLLIRKEIKKPDFKAKEIRMLKELIAVRQVPNIYGFMAHKGNVIIFMEHAGLSFDKVRNDPGYRLCLTTEDYVIGIARQGFEFLSSLAARNIIHMDIKPDNMCLRFVDGIPHLSICDFGSCVIGSHFDPDAISGMTDNYMAPEICRLEITQQPGTRPEWSEEDMVVTTQIDVHALCASLFYLKYWKDWPQVLKLNRAIKEDIKFHIATKPTLLLNLIKENWGEVLKMILNGGLEKTPGKRITPQQALAIIDGPTDPVGNVSAVSSLSITDEVPEKTDPVDTVCAVLSLSITGEVPEKTDPVDSVCAVSSLSITGEVPEKTDPDDTVCAVSSLNITDEVPEKTDPDDTVCVVSSLSITGEVPEKTDHVDTMCAVLSLSITGEVPEKTDPVDTMCAVSSLSITSGPSEQPTSDGGIDENQVEESDEEREEDQSNPRNLPMLSILKESVG